MNKKFAFIFFALLSCALVFIDAEEKDGVYKQYQVINWSPVPNAAKYEVDIEKKTNDGGWAKEAAVQTKECTQEILLDPGIYRVSVTTFSVLGKKASATDWVQFTILNEMQPYLYADNFKKSATWNSPVLHLKQAADAVTAIVTQDTQIVARAGDPANSFALHAKNVFYPETKFSFVPASASDSGGKPFASFIENRAVAKLAVVRRDPDKNTIVISYNPDDLYSGYYNLVAENPGNKTSSISILVLADKKLSVDEKSFSYDKKYLTRTLIIPRASNAHISVTGSGFDENTIFSFIPSTEGMQYPFASWVRQKNVPLVMTGHQAEENGAQVKLDFSLDASAMQTGYYKFSASRGDSSASVLVLVKISEPADEKIPASSKITFEKNSAANKAIFTMKGNALDGSRCMIVSPWIRDGDYNERIPLAQVGSEWGGSTVIFEVPAALVDKTEYALLIQNDSAAHLQFFTIDEKNRVNFILPKDDEVEEKYLRSEDAVVAKKTDDQQATVTVEPIVFSVVEKPQFFVPYLFVDAVGTFDEHFGASIQLDLFDMNWLCFRGDVTARNDCAECCLFIDAMIPVVPKFIFYAGLGFGGRTGSYAENLSFVDDLFYVNAGCILFKYADVRFTSSMGFKTLDITNQISVGCRIPLRHKKYIQVTKGVVATVEKTGVVSDSDCSLDKEETESIVFKNGITQIVHFENYTHVKTALLPDTLKSIGKNAFAGWIRLVSITIPLGTAEIRSGAFQNCSKISVLTIPATVTLVEKDAFAGWKKEQRILLSWNADDGVSRNLDGLAGTEAAVYYEDGSLYR